LVKSYPRGWQEFWEPVYSSSRKFGVDINAALEAFRLVYECVSKEEEGRPLSTGFLIGDSGKLKERLPNIAGIELRKQGVLDAAVTLRTIFGVVDGYTSAFLVAKDGTLEEVRLMPSSASVPPDSSLTPAEFDGYSHALRGVPAFALIALGSLKIAKLFCDGNLRSEVYFSGKTGEWIHRPLDEIRKNLDQLGMEKGIPQPLLYRVFTTALAMSNHRKGGTIVLGDHEEVLRQSEAPRLRLHGVNVLALKGDHERHLFNLATQEFALVVSRDGELTASSVRLLAKVPSNVKPEVGPGDGGRHRSAAEISASTHGVAFVVSDDGPITIYSEGRKTLRV